MEETYTQTTMNERRLPCTCGESDVASIVREVVEENHSTIYELSEDHYLNEVVDAESSIEDNDIDDEQVECGKCWDDAKEDDWEEKEPWQKKSDLKVAMFCPSCSHEIEFATITP